MESINAVTDIVMKVGLGVYLRGHLVSTGTPRPGSWSPLLSSLGVTCLNSSYNFSKDSITFLSICWEMVRCRGSLSKSYTRKCESFINLSNHNNSQGSFEFKLSSFEPETHLKTRLYLLYYIYCTGRIVLLAFFFMQLS